MRVAYVCLDPGVPVFGVKGCSLHVQAVLRALVRRGAEVDLFASRVGGSADVLGAAQRRVRLHPLPLDRSGDAAARERRLLDANASLWRRLATGGPYHLIYERYSLFAWAGMAFACTNAVASVLEVNAPLIDEQERHRELHLRGEAVRTTRRALRAATEVIAVSAAAAAAVRHHAPGVRVVANGVELERFNTVPPGASNEAPTVGFVGTLKPWHGLDYLLSAFALLRRCRPESELLIVGDGPERSALQDRCRRLGIAAAVRFTGAVAAAEVPSLLARMDVAVAPYPQRDDFYFSPLKLYEYMAAGRAIVASSCGEIATALGRGERGLLVPPGDVPALVAALVRLLADRPLRLQLGAAARARAVRNHGWDAVLQRILAPLAPALPAAGAR